MSKLGDELIDAMNEALAHARGEATGCVEHQVEVEVDVAAIRKKLGLSRPKFAERFGLDVRALQD